MNGNEFDFENRIMSSSFMQEEDGENENSLRPHTLDEYIGQEKAKENLRILLEAAKLRGDTLDHVLLYGPPGLGKTTLSAILRDDAGLRRADAPAVPFARRSGPSTERRTKPASNVSGLVPTWL